MNTSLYRYASDLAILERITDEETNIQLSQEELVDLIKGKVDSYTSYYQHILDYKESAKAEIERIKLLIEKADKKIESLEKYADNCLTVLDVKSIDGKFASIKRKMNPPSLNIINEDLIPLQYVKTKEVVTVSIDKKQLLADLKSGQVIDGVDIKQTTRIEFK